MTVSNNFGPISAKYAAVRRGYPIELYRYLKTLVKKSKANTLDLGCGTGIATRELKKAGFAVMGTDKDRKMIKIARQYDKKIIYVVAPADKLPFADSQFDLVTAFTAFHWFNDKKSLLEIKRVLKPGGLFFAALKSNYESKNNKVLHKKYRAILKKYAGNNFDRTYKHFKKQFLRKLFSQLKEKSFRVDEKYTVPESLLLIQSLSLWNLVSTKNKPRMLKELKELYNAHKTGKFITRNREIFAIVGKKVS